MSYSGNAIPLDAQAPSPLDALLKYTQAQAAQAGIGQTQAQTGLIGAQTQGAELNNQQLQLMLGLRGALVGSILPGAPGAVGPAAQGSPAGMPGAAPAAAAAGTGAAGPQLPPPMSPFGATMSPFGVPLPRSTYLAAVMQPNPMEGLTQAYNMGRQRIATVLSQAGNPQQVQAAATQLYQEGWLDQNGYQALYSDPTKKQAFIDSTASPDSHMAQFTALTGQGLTKNPDGSVSVSKPAVAAKTATTLAGRTGETMDVTVPGPGGTKVTVKGTVMPDGSVVGLNGQPLRGAIPVAGADTGLAPPSDALSKLPPAQQAMVKNVAANSHEDPNVVAAQWTRETSGSLTPPTGDGGKSFGTLQVQQEALDDYNKARGTNLTLDDLQAAPRLGLQIGTEIRQMYTKQFDNNPVVGAMAYNWGSGNVDQWRAAGSDPNAVPPAVQAYAKALYGPNAMGMAQAPAAAGGTQAGATPATAAAPAAAGIGTSAPQFTPQQQTAIDIDKGRLSEDQKLVTDAQSGAMKAQVAMPVVLDLRQRAAADPAAFGSAGDLRTTLSNALATFGPEWSQKLTAWATDNKIDPSSTGGRQAIMKEAFNLVTSAESQMSGSVRVGALLTNYFSKAMPNINMQGDAVKEMLNFILVGNQMTRDYAQGAAAHFNAASAAFPAQNPLAQRYAPLTQFDEKWTAPGAASAPNVYEAASNILNGRPYDVWAKGLNRAEAADQQAEAIRIATRADPSFRLGAGQLPPRAAP